MPLPLHGVERSLLTVKRELHVGVKPAVYFSKFQKEKSALRARLASQVFFVAKTPPPPPERKSVARPTESAKKRKRFLQSADSS